MARKQPTRTAQKILETDFNFSWNDWVIDPTDSAKKTLGSSVALSVDPTEVGLSGPVANTVSFDSLNMPLGAVIVGGSLIVETAGVGPTAYTVSLGVVGNLAAVLPATSLLVAARTPLPLTLPLVSNAGQNIRMTVAYTVANATAGRFRLRINYTIDGRAEEAIGN